MSTLRPASFRSATLALSCALLTAAAVQAQNKPSSWLTTNFLARSHSTAQLTMAYRLFVPADYDSTRKYPIVVTLHGVGERGNDNSSALTREELAQPWVRDSVQAKHPHFVLIPQCPSTNNQYWWPWNNWSGSWNGAWSGTRSNANAAIVGILDSLKREFSLDTTRFYVAGLSMGAFGTFELMKWNPGLFAAAVPAAGGSDSSAAAIEAMARTPAWVFHGAADNIIFPVGSRRFVSRVEALRGEPFVRFVSGANRSNPTGISLDSLRKAVYEDQAAYLYSEVTGGNHAAGWFEAWRHPMLTDWVFSRRKVGGVPMVSLAGARPAKAVGAPNARLVMREGGLLLERRDARGNTVRYNLEGRRQGEFGIKN